MLINSCYVQEDSLFLFILFCKLLLVLTIHFYIKANNMKRYQDVRKFFQKQYELAKWVNDPKIIIDLPSLKVYMFRLASLCYKFSRHT